MDTRTRGGVGRGGRLAGPCWGEFSHMVSQTIHGTIRVGGCGYDNNYYYQQKKKKKKNSNLTRRLPKRVEPWFIFHESGSNSDQELVKISPFWLPYLSRVRRRTDIAGAHLTEGKVSLCCVSCIDARVGESAVALVRHSGPNPGLVRRCSSLCKCPGDFSVPGSRHHLTSG